MFSGMLMAAASATAQTSASFAAEGSQALAAGNLNAALTSFRRAAKIDPANPQIQFNLGLTLVRMGKLSQAIAPLKRAAREPSLAAEAHFLLGASYFEVRQYANAIGELKQLQMPAQPERVLYMLEESNRVLGRAAEAQDAFRKLNRQYPDSAWTHFLLATAYENQQQWDIAITEYQNALKADSTIPNANFAIGYIFWRERNFDAAREWLQKEAAHGCHALANLYLGEIAQRSQDVPSAENRYRTALRCDASLADAHSRLGVLLASQKRYQEAIVQLKEAIRLEPANSSSHYHLGSVYRAMGRKAEANAEYAKVRQLQAAADASGSPGSGESRP
jgi:tetratricopeptide (TPR) repeat protein